MRKHINQYVFSPLFLVMIFLLVTLFLLVVALFTPVGPKMAAYIADSLFEELRVTGVSGSIISGLHVNELEWSSDAIVALKDIDLKIIGYDTKTKKLIVTKASVGKLSINIPESHQVNNSPYEKITLPDFGLPINIDADLLELKSLQITKTIESDPSSRTLVFEIRAIDLKQAVIKDGYLNFANLRGAPIILNQALQIDVVNGRLNMNKPHDLKTAGTASYNHSDLGEFSGVLDLSGTLTDYDFNSDLIWQQKYLGQQLIKLDGKGNYRQVALNKLKAISEHGIFDATGIVNWDPEIRWNFNLLVEDMDTNKLLPEWPLNATAKLKYTGSYIDSRLENQIDVLALNGTFKDQKLSAQGQINEREGLVRVNNFDILLGDNSFRANGAVTEPLNIDLAIDAKNIKQLIPQLAGDIKGKAALKGTYKKPEIKTKFTANNLVFNDFTQSKIPIIVESSLGINNGELILENFLLNSGINRLKAEGKVSEPFTIAWDINAQNLNQVSPQLGGSIKGSGDLKGTLETLESNLVVSMNNASFKGYKQGNKPLDIKGKVALDKNVISIKQLIAASGRNTVQLSGQASEPLNLSVKVDAKNLMEVSPDFSGRIQADTTITGQYKSPIIKTTASASKLSFKDTLLTNSELSVKGEIQLSKGVPIIKSLNAQAGENSFIISGRASSPYDLNWEIDSKNLAQISPEFSGLLVAKGKLQGSIDNPILNGTINAKKIKYKTFELGAADFKASTNNGIYKIKGNLNNLKGKNQTVNKAEIDLNGRLENHTLLASIDHDEGKLSIKANGAWQKQTWSGQVSTLKLAETKTGDWNLHQPTRIAISANSVKVDKFCLGNNKTQACSTLNYTDGGGFAAKGTLIETPLSLLKPFLPDYVALNGNVSGNYDIQQNKGKPTGTLKFTLPDNSFTVKGEDKDGDDDQSFAYKGVEINATIDNRTVLANASMTIIDRGKLSASATIKLSPEDGKHTIDGIAKLDIPNIYFVQNLIPRSRGLRGEFTSKISFNGLLSNPQIKGQADIKNAYLRLPEAGSEITNINISVRADQPGRAVINGKMMMGKGLLNVGGDVDLRDFKKWKSTITLKGSDLRFMNTNEIRATMSPDLVVGLSSELVKIQGKVIIPEADIQLKNIPETSIDESTDAVVIGEKLKTENVSAVKIRPDVIIELGDKIKVNAFGLKAKLSGDVKITNNRSDILANGSLRVFEGKYEAYGQTLDIDNGRLIFNGSPKIVGMDIRATRKVDDTVVGIQLGGTLLNPKSTIFSDPTLPESEALSLLITGHSLSSSSGRESALLLSAVRGLGVTGSSGSLIQSIGSSFGLDDVNIVTKDSLEQSELALGKRLGSKLYVRYLVGLFDQAQTIAVQYKINKLLSLETQLSTEDYGLDFIYQIERD